MENLGNTVGSLLTAGVLAVAIPNANAEAPNNTIESTKAQVKKDCQDGLTCAQTEIQLASLDHENENTDPKYIRYYKLKEKGAFKELFAKNSEHEKTIIAYIDSVDEEIKGFEKKIDKYQKIANEAQEIVSNSKDPKVIKKYKRRYKAALRAIESRKEQIKEYGNSMYILSGLPTKHQIDAMEIFGLIPEGKRKGYHKKITVDFLKIADHNVRTKDEMRTTLGIERTLKGIETGDSRLSDKITEIVDEETLESEQRAKRSKENRKFIEDLHDALKG